MKPMNLFNLQCKQIHQLSWILRATRTPKLILGERKGSVYPIFFCLLSFVLISFLDSSFLPITNFFPYSCKFSIFSSWNHHF